MAGFVGLNPSRSICSGRAAQARKLPQRWLCCLDPLARRSDQGPKLSEETGSWPAPVGPLMDADSTQEVVKEGRLVRMLADAQAEWSPEPIHRLSPAHPPRVAALQKWIRPCPLQGSGNLRVQADTPDGCELHPLPTFFCVKHHAVGKTEVRVADGPRLLPPCCWVSLCLCRRTLVSLLMRLATPLDAEVGKRHGLLDVVRGWL